MMFVFTLDPGWSAEQVVHLWLSPDGEIDNSQRWSWLVVSRDEPEPGLLAFELRPAALH